MESNVRPPRSDPPLPLQAHARTKVTPSHVPANTKTGILLAYIVNFAFASAEHWGWRVMFGLPAVIAVAQGLGMLLLPETPRWLCLQKRTEEAKDVIKKLRKGVPQV